MKINIGNSRSSLSYWRLGAALYSQKAQDNEIENIPGKDFNPQYPDLLLTKSSIITNLGKLFRFCINPITRKFKGSLALTSVYRTKEVNRLLGGVENSQYIYGYAADMVLTDNTPTYTLFNWCRYNLPFYHQLIWEYPEKGIYGQGITNYSWVHISYIEGDNHNINSVSSTDPKIHTAYKDEKTFHLDNFTHRIEAANPEVINI